MRILITGGSGYTGSNLAVRLMKKDYEVRILARRKSPKTDYLQNLNAEICFGDITDRTFMNKIIKGIDIVYHFAAIGFRKIALPDKVYWETNVGGTRNILDASLKENVKRFIHCSTVGVHGHISKPPANETYPYNPGDLYQKTKLEGEKLAKKYFHEKGLPVVVIRPCGIYGPEETRMLRLFRMIYQKKFFMIGKGDVCYHQVFIDDLIDAFELCGERSKAIGQVYIIGGNRSPTINELVSIIAEALGVPTPTRRFPFILPVLTASWACELVFGLWDKEPPISRRRLDFFLKNRSFDISKAKKELSYDPKVDLETGIRITAEWYKKQGWL